MQGEILNCLFIGSKARRRGMGLLFLRGGKGGNGTPVLSCCYLSLPLKSKMIYHVDAVTKVCVNEH